MRNGRKSRRRPSGREQEELLRSGDYTDGNGFGVVIAMKELQKRGR